MGMKKVLVAPGARARPLDSGQGDSPRPQPGTGRGREIHVRSSPLASQDDILREPGGHLGAHLEAARSDCRSQDGKQRLRTGERGQSRFQDPIDQTSPSRVHQSNPVSGGTEENRETVSGTHGEHEPGGACPNSVACLRGLGTLGPCHLCPVDLTRPNLPGIGRGRGERGQGSPSISGVSHPWEPGTEPQDHRSLLHSPEPLHGRAG